MRSGLEIINVFLNGREPLQRLGLDMFALSYKFTKQNLSCCPSLIDLLHYVAQRNLEAGSMKQYQARAGECIFPDYQTEFLRKVVEEVERGHDILGVVRLMFDFCVVEELE